MRSLLLAVLFLVFVAACSSGSAVSGPGLYIALGDSLSQGVGASDPSATAFVPLVYEGLDEGFELMSGAWMPCARPSTIGPNLAAALDRLREADPDLTIVVVTLCNPFSGGLEPIDVLAELALEGEPERPFPEGLNDIIRVVAEERGLTLVDWHLLFEGKAGEYIAGDLIHPDDAGYRVMADAVLGAVR